MRDPNENQPLGQSVSEIIDRATSLVHDEIELARTEITIALKNLLRGSVASILGGVFAFFGLIMLLMGISLFLTDLIADQYPWLGFFIVALFMFVIGGVASIFALKKIQKGSKLIPEMAIDEARKTQDALQVEEDPPTGIQQYEAVAVEETTEDAGDTAIDVKLPEPTAEEFPPPPSATAPEKGPEATK